MSMERALTKRSTSDIMDDICQVLREYCFTKDEEFKTLLIEKIKKSNERFGVLCAKLIEGF